MNDHPARAENVARPRGAEPNRYAITLAALLATAQVPVADQVEEQPPAPPHDYSMDRIGFGGQADKSARVSRPEERIWDRHVVGSPMNTNSTQ